jgi:predicted ATPase
MNNGRRYLVWIRKHARYRHAGMPSSLEALINQIVSFAEQSPVLMIVEDIHWVDPTTLEALGRGIERIKSASLDDLMNLNGSGSISVG